MSRRAPGYAGLLAAALTLHPGALLAQDVPPPSLLQQGVELRRQGRDAEALEVFRRAWDLTRSPRARAQMALAEQAVGRWLDAEEHLREALAATDDPWITTRRAALTSALATMQQHVGVIELEGGVPGASVSLDGRPAGALPLPAPIRVLVGPVRLEVRAEGYDPLTREVMVMPASTQRVAVSLTPRPAPAPVGVAPHATVPTRRGLARGWRYAGWGAVGLGVALGAVAVVQWARTLAQAEASADALANDGEWGAWVRYGAAVNPTGALPASEVCARAANDPSPRDAAQVRSLCEDNATARWMALGFGLGGAVLAGVGVALVALAASEPSTPRARVAPVLGAGLQGATLEVSF